MKTNIKILSRIASSYFSMLVLTAFTFNLPGDCQGDKASTKPIHKQKKQPCSDNQIKKDDTSYSKTPKTNPSTDIEKEAKTTEPALPTSKDQNLDKAQTDIDNAEIESIKNSKKESHKRLDLIDQSLKDLLNNINGIKALQKFDFESYLTQVQDIINKVIAIRIASHQDAALTDPQKDKLAMLKRELKTIDMHLRNFLQWPASSKTANKIKKDLENVKKEANKLYEEVSNHKTDKKNRTGYREKALEIIKNYLEKNQINHTREYSSN